MTKIGGPSSGYRITPDAGDAGRAMSDKEVLDSAGRAGAASDPEVREAIDHALDDKVLSLGELSGGRAARALRAVGIDVGGSIVSTMKRDGLLQRDQIDPADYRECVRLLERAALPQDHDDRIELGDGVEGKLHALVDDFQRELIAGPKAGAFIEKIQDDKLGAQKVVNQTAMTWAPVDTEAFLERLPPERWAEECYDLKNLHNQVLERRALPDGGYEVVMLQRMEFGAGSTATDMTKRTVVRKWRDPENGQWRASAQWKVYSSDPTRQIDHAGSMRIDTGRMEFRPVERDGKKYTEVLFNNATQTDTTAEQKLLGLLGKNTPLRQELSAKIGSSPFGITAFAGDVVSRYREVGTGQQPARWPDMAVNTEE